MPAPPSADPLSNGVSYLAGVNADTVGRLLFDPFVSIDRAIPDPASLRLVALPAQLSAPDSSPAATDRGPVAISPASSSEVSEEAFWRRSVACF